MPQRNIVTSKEYTPDDCQFFYGIRVIWHDYTKRKNVIKNFSFFGKSKSEINQIRKDVDEFVKGKQRVVDNEWLNFHLNKFGEIKHSQNRVVMNMGLPGVHAAVFDSKANSCPSIYIKWRVARKDLKSSISNCTRSTLIEKWKGALVEYCNDQSLDFEWFLNKYNDRLNLSKANLPNIFHHLIKSAHKHLAVRLVLEERLYSPKSTLQRGMRTGLQGLSVSYGYNGTKGDFDCQCQIREYANGDTKAFSFSSYEQFKVRWPEIIRIYREFRPSELITIDDYTAPPKKEWDLMVRDGINLHEGELATA